MSSIRRASKTHGSRLLSWSRCWLLILLILSTSRAEDGRHSRLREALSSSDSSIRHAAQAVLVSGGLSSLPLIRESLSEAKDPEVRRALLDAWRRITGYTPGKPSWAAASEKLDPEWLLPTEATHRKSGVRVVLVPPDEEGKAFYLGKYELTYEQWQCLVRGRRSGVKDEKGRLPACSVDVKLMEYVLKDFGLRLPSKLEWKRACGKDYKASNNTAWYKSNCFSRRPVGGKEPNKIGAHDMLGNVWEWAVDNNAYVMCGGSFRNNIAWLSWKTAVRMPVAYSSKQIGFRVALSP